MPKTSPTISPVVLVTLNVAVLAVAALAGAAIGNPKEHFGEGDFVTFFSTVQLLAVSVACHRVFRMRRGRVGAEVWAIIAAGFLFLALDEQFRLHESMDKRLHELVGMAETRLTDHLDDLIIGLYGIVGMVVVVRRRHELLRCRKTLLLGAAGFALMFLMVLADMINQRSGLFPQGPDAMASQVVVG